MNKFKTLSAAAILSLMFAAPVFTQAAMQEPRLFAFIYLNARCFAAFLSTPL